jgi:hypothetical protein
MVDQTATSGSVGAGQQEPLDSNSDWYAISFMIAQKMAELEVMMPVQVVAVNPGSGSPPAAGTVDVQLLVSLLDGAGNAVQQGIVHGVPYFRLQGGAWAVVIDPAANDFGYVVSASRDITAVKAKPGIQNPGSLRKHSYSDGVYVGGILNAVPAGRVWLKPDGTWSLTDKPGNVLQGDANGITATPISGKPFKVVGNLQVTGTIASGEGGGDQVSLQTHTHSGVQTGGGSSGPPNPGT